MDFLISTSSIRKRLGDLGWEAELNTLFRYAPRTFKEHPSVYQKKKLTERSKETLRHLFPSCITTPDSVAEHEKRHDRVHGGSESRSA